MTPVSCVTLSLFCISFLNFQVFFFLENMLIITKQLIKSNPETFFSDVADFTIYGIDNNSSFFQQFLFSTQKLQLFFFRNNR